ncbi:DivIVA domain-containing protein [Micromonospora avicenniae]|uniref:DivIVA domain-containing protein n=1 Tax=Micromonospora avicenniae TaxID=1198245 RepID=UPI003333A252
MASQGQRFRRKAVRRGYKVDEVDAFLDRVEATLAGQPVGAPVASQEVHDVVFRVRFNGYDEWQVDLHLDRVERQLAELEERGGVPGRGGDSGMGDRLGQPDRLGPPDRMGPPDRLGPPDRMGPPDRLGPPDRMGPPDRLGPPDRMGPPDRLGPPDRMGPPDRLGPPDRMGSPMRDERGMPPVPQPPLPPRPMPAQAGPPTDRYGRYDEPTGAFSGGYDAPRGGYDGPRPPAGPGPGMPMGPGGPGGAPLPQRGLPSAPSGYGPEEPRFDGFEAGRRARPDMTAEIRMPERDPREMMPERDPRDMRRGPAGPPPMPQQGFGGAPMGGPPAVPGPPPMAGPPMGGPPMAGPPGSDLYRVDQIRRSFQVRRFGSGYDPDQVDRFFESLLGGMAGRNPMPVNPKDLDTLRFGLVPGGYFEAEVDAALKDVQDILFGR